MTKKKCAICKVRDVYDINSHLTPRAISENTYGKHNKEHIISITPHEGVIDEFFGRSHPDAPEEIKLQPNVKKGIFCKECETGLGKFESICQKPLLLAVADLAKGDLAVIHEGGVKYFVLPIPSNVMRTYFYSVVWRQCYEQLDSGSDSPLNPAEYDQLRIILNSEIHKPIDDVSVSNSFEGYPSLVAFTSYYKTGFNGFNNPNPTITNPELFFISEYACLYWKNNAVTNNIEGLIKVPQALIDRTTLLNTGAKESKIAIVNEGTFRRMKKQMVQKTADEFIKTHVIAIAKFKRMSLVHAEVLLRTEAEKLRGPDGSPAAFTRSIIAASKQLLGGTM